MFKSSAVMFTLIPKNININCDFMSVHCFQTLTTISTFFLDFKNWIIVKNCLGRRGAGGAFRGADAPTAKSFAPHKIIDKDEKIINTSINKIN